MSLTLEEMNEDWEKRHRLAVESFDIEEEDEEDEEDEDDDFDSDAALNEACDLLQELMETLGQWGQRRHAVSHENKKDMLRYAQQIWHFLESIGEISEDKP